MNKKMKVCSVLSLLFLQGCFVYGEKDQLSLNTIIKKKELFNSTLSSVNIANNQVTITGVGFSKATSLNIKGNGVDANLKINSASDSKIVATATSALSLLVGSTFDLIIGTADAQAIYAITFTLQNGAVQSSNLASMGASSGQVLKYNGSTWEAASLSNSQIYLGTWNASTNNPDISTLGSFQNGDYFIVSTAGTFNSIAYSIGDWAMFNGTAWDKIDNTSNVVASFNGRKGVVTLTPADYVSLKDTTTHKVTGSSLNDVADIDLTTAAPTNGQILKWNSTTHKWAPSDDITSGGSGSVGPTEIAAGSIADSHINATADIAQSKIHNLTTDLAAKESTITAGATTQYYRGDKSWQTLNTTVVTEGTNLYFTNARALGVPLAGVDTTQTTAITSSDSILVALGKTQGQINLKANSASIIDWSVSGVPVVYPTRVYGGALQANKTLVTDGTGYIATSSVTPTELGYVGGVTSAIQTQINNLSNGSVSNQWTANGGNIYRSSGNVGVGTTAPADKLTVSNGTGEIRFGGANGRSISAYSSGSLANFDFNAVQTNFNSDLLIANGYKISTNNTSTANLYLTTTDTTKGIYTDRNVGIGTSSPAGTLDVEGGTAAAATDGNNIVLQAQAGGSGNQNGGNVIIKGGLLSGTGGNGQVLLGISSKSGWGNATVNTGNMGISGTLHMSNNPIINVSGISSASNGAAVLPFTSNAGAESGRFDGGGRFFVGFTADQGGGQKLQINSGAYFSGNVGVGTITPAQKLSVAGTIQSTSGGFMFPDGTTMSTANVASSQIADGSLPLAKLTGARDATKYLKGDNSWSTFATDVIASVLSSFTVDTNSKPVVTNTDTVSSAFGKVQKYLNDINGDYISKSASGQSISGTFNFTSPVAFLYSNTPTGTTATEVANVQYVTNSISANGVWNKSASDINYTAGKVGIGTTAPSRTLHVVGPYYQQNRAGQDGNDVNGFLSADGVRRLAVYTTPSYSMLQAENGARLDFGVTGDLTKNINFWWNNNSNIGMTVQNSSGNVGIGTTTPAALLSLAQGTTAAGGISFGGDTNLYRSAANELITDNNFTVGGSYLRLNTATVLLGSGSFSGGPDITFRSSGAPSSVISPVFKIKDSTGSLQEALRFSPVWNNSTPGSLNETVTASALGSNIFSVNATASSALINFLSNVGIGTASPLSRLMVQTPGSVAQEAGLTLAHSLGTAGSGVSIDFYPRNPSNPLLAQIVGGSNLGPVGQLYFNTYGSGLLTTKMAILDTGNVGIGTTSPNATLQVNGTITGKASVLNATSTVDFATGNQQYTASSCGAFTLNNLKDGGSYAFAIQGSTAALCSFNAFSDAGVTALTVHMPTNHGLTTASAHTLYNYMVMGTHVYVSWVPGY